MHACLAGLLARLDSHSLDEFIQERRALGRHLALYGESHGGSLRTVGAVMDADPNGSLDSLVLAVQRGFEDVTREIINVRHPFPPEPPWWRPRRRASWRRKFKSLRFVLDEVDDSPD
jgi:hypothetical protein